MIHDGYNESLWNMMSEIDRQTIADINGLQANSEPRHGDWSQTYSARKFYPLDVRVEDFSVQDIAASLSKLCRFCGHCLKFYSVAEHSVRVSRLIESILRSHCCSELECRIGGMYGLFHETMEAYLSDIVRPLKYMPEMKPYRDVEKRGMSTAWRWLGLPDVEPWYLKYADNVLLVTEKRDLMKDGGLKWNINVEPLKETIIPVSPDEAERMFYERLYELTDHVSAEKIGIFDAVCYVSGNRGPVERWKPWCSKKSIGVSATNCDTGQVCNILRWL